VRLKENLERVIFEKQDAILKVIRFFMVLSSFGVLGVMVYRYGFNHTQINLDAINLNAKFFYFVFIISFSVRYFISSEKKQYLINNLLELVLIGVVVFNYICLLFLGYPFLEKMLMGLGIPNPTGIYHFLLQFILLCFVGIEFVKGINLIYSSTLKPTTLFLISFIVLILMGALLLSLPGFNTTGQYMNYVNALFTSASACCVTGLTVENTATFFNLKGQLVILFLIQMGGIGILTFASFFAGFIKKGIGVRHQFAMNQLLDTENLSGTTFLLKRILLMTFVIELIGAVGIYVLWGDYTFANHGDRIYHSIFHSISAFCNAGFSTLEFGMETPLASELYMLHIFMGFIIIIGGIGFPVIRDVFSPIKLRQRLKEPWRDWNLSSKIAIYGSLILITIGTVAFYFLHVKDLEHIKTPFGKFAVSFFQSVNTRTSGFSSINLNEMPTTLIMISMFLMFIGASSSSTGGGIKTSTFVIMMLAVLGTIKGKREMTLDKRTIGTDLIYKAFAVVVFSGLFVLLTITILSFTENNMSLAALAYESISAFATVGLTTGITPHLTDASKLVLVMSMFVGRVGVLSLAFSLSSRVNSSDNRYASTHLMIG